MRAQSFCVGSATVPSNNFQALASAIEMRDPYTGGHTARVTAYSLLMGEGTVDCAPKDMDDLRTGGPLHDIGKIGIDDAILRKPDKLTDAEFDIMKTHTTLGDDILKSIPELHVRFVRSCGRTTSGGTGRGYPDKLAGEAIPLPGPRPPRWPTRSTP